MGRPPSNRPPLPNRRADYPEDSYVPPRRRWADLSVLERVVRSMNNLGAVFSLFTFLYIAIGFRTIKPNDRIGDVERGLAELRAARDSDRTLLTRMISTTQDSILRVLAPMQRRTSAVARDLCFKLPVERTYELDLDCYILLPGYRRFQQDDARGPASFRGPPNVPPRSAALFYPTPAARTDRPVTLHKDP